MKGNAKIKVTWEFEIPVDTNDQALLIQEAVDNLVKIWTGRLKNGKIGYEIELPKPPTKMFMMSSDGRKCPICGIELSGCHFAEYCSEKNGGCGKWCDGYAELTNEQQVRLKGKIIR